MSANITAENAWLNWGGGCYAIQFYLGEGKGNLTVKIPKSADIFGTFKRRKVRAFKATRNIWGGKTVKLDFKTPKEAQLFQETLSDADDVLFIQDKKTRGGLR